MKIDLFENQTPNGQLKLDNEAKTKQIDILKD